MPSLPAATDTVIYLYYGNNAAAPQQHPGEVWDRDFGGVWHLSQNPGAPAPQILDSSGHAYDGTTTGTMTAAGSVAGATGAGLDLDGVDDSVEVGDVLRLGWGSLTITGWMRRGSTDTDEGIVDKKDSTCLTDDGYMIDIDVSRGQYMRGYIADNQGVDCATGDGIEIRSNVDILDTQWHHFAMVFARDDAANTRFMVDGFDVSTISGSVNSIDYVDGADILTFGNRELSTSWWLHGGLDEIRISTAVRSPGWIIASYNNQRDPARFLNFGREEDRP